MRVLLNVLEVSWRCYGSVISGVMKGVMITNIPQRCINNLLTDDLDNSDLLKHVSRKSNA